MIMETKKVTGWIQGNRLLLILFLTVIIGLLIGWLILPHRESALKTALKASEEKQLTLQNIHLQDSVIFRHKTDSLTFKIGELRTDIIDLEQQLAAVPGAFVKEQARVRILPDSMAVDYFTERCAGILLDKRAKDSLPADIMEPIRGANITLVALDECKQSLSINEKLNKKKDSVIQVQDEVIGTLKLQAVNLTRDYYRAQKLTDDLQAAVKKSDRKARTQKILLGTAIGIEAAGIIAVLIFH